MAYDAGYLEDLIQDKEGRPDDEKDVDRLQLIKEAKKFPKWLHLVGSALYSNKKYIADVDLISTKPLTSVFKFFDENYTIIDVIRQGKRIMTITVLLLDIPVHVDVWFATEDELPFMLLAFSYPRRFNIAIRKKFKNMGMRLNQYGLHDQNGKKIRIGSPDEIFKILGIPFRTPAQEGRKLNL